MRHPAQSRHVSPACLLALTLILAPACTKAPAADPKPADDPKARQLLDEVSKAYQKLDSYSDQGEFVLSATVNGKSETLRTPLKLSLVRPNKMRLDSGEVLVVSDGTTLTTSVAPLKKYTTAPAPKTLSFETFRQGPLGSILFGGPSATPMYVFLNLLVGSDPAKAIAELDATLKLDADPVEGDVPCKALLIDQQQG